MPYLIEILLPVGHNIQREEFETIRSELTDRFGGVTLHTNSPADGLWEKDDTVQRDRIVIVEIMAEEVDRAWWRQYRERLELQLSQEEIVVRATQTERL